MKVLFTGCTFSDSTLKKCIKNVSSKSKRIGSKTFF